MFHFWYFQSETSIVRVHIFLFLVFDGDEFLQVFWVIFLMHLNVSNPILKVILWLFGQPVQNLRILVELEYFDLPSTGLAQIFCIILYLLMVLFDSP